MMDYIIRFVLCSGFFIAIYYTLLYNEKMFRFNRYYLLLSLIASLFIPVLTIENNPTIVEQVESMVMLNTQQVAKAIELSNTPKTSKIPWGTILLGLYGIVSLTLLFRFLVLNWILLSKTKYSKLKNINKASLALTEVSSPPHSYFNHIFITKQDYENGFIDQKIIDHELAHVVQKHSLDILFIELIVVLTWFNPFIYFYRNAIRLNHEFLADDAVIQKSKDVFGYKHLIVNHSAFVNGLMTNSSLSSSFNYLNTKKRLAMLTTNSIARKIFLKKCCLAPLAFIAILMFSKNTVAKDFSNAIDKVQKEIITQQDDSEEELQAAFDEILEKYIRRNEKTGTFAIHMNFRETADSDKLLTIYQKMSKSQQSKQKVQYGTRWPLEKMVPTKEDFEKWKDAKVYGVWLDGKRISNDELDNYTNTDFSHYFISGLTKTAKNYGKYKYHLSLQTNEDFAANNKKITTEPKWMPKAWFQIK